MGNPEQLSSQQSLLERIDYRKISRGATFPLDHVERLSDEVGSIVLNAGCGPGEKVLRQAERLRAVDGRVVGVDINPQAVASSRIAAVNAIVSNALFIEGNVSDNSFMGRWYGGEFNIVIAEGLLCNLMEDDPSKTVTNFYQVLKSGGLVCIADCLRMDDPAFMNLMEQRYDYVPTDVSHEIASGYVRQWEWRYKQNVELGGLIDDQRLENGVFVVLPPDVNKRDMSAVPNIGGYDELPDDFEIKKMEYLEASSLANLVKAGFVERLARHWEASELRAMFADSGFKNFLWEETLWYTRTNEPLLGVIATFRRN